MAWTRLTNGTTADANDVHDNFREVRSGSLIPMKLSTTAAQTTGAYDIGSATYKWRDGHFSGSISAADHAIITAPRIIANTSLAATSAMKTFAISGDTTTAEYEISAIYLTDSVHVWKGLNLIINGMSAGASWPSRRYVTENYFTAASYTTSVYSRNTSTGWFVVDYEVMIPTVTAMYHYVNIRLHRSNGVIHCAATVKSQGNTNNYQGFTTMHGVASLGAAISEIKLDIYGTTASGQVKITRTL